ncbi:hypothetical protein L3V79_08275 [Thiotrichales bacterium 19S9-12]|nr:hypothetical protein [Thiotrichales bacterium 19S9-11]MCF6812349.1 hypothetical protein [Thiotrichales bacterium 19S9-12]
MLDKKEEKKELSQSETLIDKLKELALKLPSYQRKREFFEVLKNSTNPSENLELYLFVLVNLSQIYQARNYYDRLYALNDEKQRILKRYGAYLENNQIKLDDLLIKNLCTPNLVRRKLNFSQAKDESKKDSDDEYVLIEDYDADDETYDDGGPFLETDSMSSPKKIEIKPLKDKGIDESSTEYIDDYLKTEQGRKSLIRNGFGPIPGLNFLREYNYYRILINRLNSLADEIDQTLGASKFMEKVSYADFAISTVSSIWKLPNLLRHLALSIQHTIDDGDLDYVRKYADEMISGALGVFVGTTTLGMSNELYLMGLSPIFGPGGIFLVIGYYVLDVILSAGKKISRSNSYERVINDLNFFITDNEAIKKLKEQILLKSEYHKLDRNISFIQGLLLCVAVSVSLISGPVAPILSLISTIIITVLDKTVKADYLKQKEVEYTTDQLSLLHYRLLTHIEDQIEKLEKEVEKDSSSSFKNKKTSEKYKKYESAYQDLLIWQYGQNENYLSNCLEKIIEASQIRRDSYWFEPNSLKSLKTVLEPFSSSLDKKHQNIRKQIQRFFHKESIFNEPETVFSSVADQLKTLAPTSSFTFKV